MVKKAKKNPEILKKMEEIKELKDKYLRLAAEFENYKKRTIKEKEDFGKYAKENIINELMLMKVTSNTKERAAFDGIQSRYCHNWC